VTVNDLSGTDVTTVRSDLAGIPGGNTGDGEPDDVIVKGTNGDDVAQVTGSNGTANVIGLAAAVHVANAEPANDTLTLDLLAGDDVGEASGLASNSVELTMDAGAGDDVLVGSAGDDVMFGRDGDDTLVGGPGLDILDGGNGNNTVIQD
jgi:Ca2+-binding RTX toxin-like protein